MYSLRNHTHTVCTLAALLVVWIIAAYTTPIAHAQLSSTNQPDPVQYTIAPEVPGPNQSVSIFIEGVGSFLGNATVTWEKDGVVAATGVGKNSYSFTTGGVGRVTVIHLTIDSPTQGTITHDFAFNPSVVNLVWEADTTAPTFYLGKPLYSAGSSARVVAFPTILSNGALAANNTLSFQWSLNNTLAPTQSGIGRNVFTFTGDELQTSESVSVDVYLGGTKVGHSDITIPVSTPQLVLYNQDPLRGEVLDQALSGPATLSAKEVTLVAEPYFFSTASKKDGSLSYTWMLNSSEVTGPDSAHGVLTLRQTSSGAGSAQIGVSVQNTNNTTFMQAAQTGIYLTFGTQTGAALSNFFGI